MKENANVGVMYTEWLRPLDGESPEELPRGEGTVIRRKTHPIAVYRDDAGALHEMTAVCPHLKCIVHWNTLEKSWDCPCHGSRFDAMGKVFTGPAVSSLEPVDDGREADRRGVTRRYILWGMVTMRRSREVTGLRI